MIKRHGLVVFLFCFSIILGITIAILEAAQVFFFSIGILFLAGLAAALFGAVVISWLAFKRKSHIRNPEQSVRHQGTAFGVWFAAHNLFWAFTGSLFIWVVFKLFGFKPWVMIFSAGALACTCFALIGTFLIRQGKMLGLCWQSAIPDGLANFWARAGATMILRERYEYAAQHDQKQHTPLLWSISRIFNRSKAGGADRGIVLLEPRPTFLAKKLKKEWLHRFKVLLVLFWVTAALAALAGVLFASHHWDRVPEGWPSDKIKASKAGKAQMMASKNSQPENPEKSCNKDENKQTDQEQKKQPDQVNQSNQTDQNPQKTGDTDQNGSNREQERKKGKKSKDQETEGQGQGQGQEQGQGQQGQGQEQQDQSQGQSQEQKGRGQGQGQQAQGKGQEQEQQEQSQGQRQDKDQAQGQGQQGQDQGQDQREGQGQGQGQGQPDQGQGQGQEQQGEGQGQGKGKGQGQGQGEGQGQGQGQSQEQGQGQNQEPSNAQTNDANAGIGEGQDLGDPNKPPEMLSEPERLPEIPSRATEMVSLELPTLTDAESKGSKDREKETPDDRILSPKSEAPSTQFKTGKQERRSTKPEQYLPNWILNLLKQEKPVKTGKK